MLWQAQIWQSMPGMPVFANFGLFCWIMSGSASAIEGLRPGIAMSLAWA
jgi:hypothetical protein